MIALHGVASRAATIFCLGLVNCLVFAAGPGTGIATPPKPLTPPISLLDLMRASIEIPADGIWAAEAADKLSDDEWLLADQDAVNLVAATSLVSILGTGNNDRKRAANADWQSWNRDMQETALQIRTAAKVHDQTKFAALGDHLQEICSGCHGKYRPETPSDGILRYPFYPKRELAK